MTTENTPGAGLRVRAKTRQRRLMGLPAWFYRSGPSWHSGRLETDRQKGE